MKIKCTTIFRGRKFVAKSDDDLENMTELEALVDIFSAIQCMIDDIYDMEPDDKELKTHLYWEVRYFDDVLVVSKEKFTNDDLIWSDRIRMLVYAIIKATYKKPDNSQVNTPIGMYRRQYTTFPAPQDAIMIQALGLDIYASYMEKYYTEKLLDDINIEFQKLEDERKVKHRKRGDNKK